MISARRWQHKSLASLVLAIDDVMETPHTTAHRLQGVLKTWLEKGARLPMGCDTPNTDHYARREVYRSGKHGYTIVAMTWRPGQGTPLHDHCGQWCVEGVVRGTLTITQHERHDVAGQIRFKEMASILAGPGSAGSLIPPHEYHTIQNNGQDEAVSVHVYQGEMTHCSAFIPDWTGGYRKLDKPLSVDPSPGD